MRMDICPYCGSNIDVTKKYCERCGMQLPESSVYQNTQQNAPQPQQPPQPQQFNSQPYSNPSFDYDYAMYKYNRKQNKRSGVKTVLIGIAIGIAIVVSIFIALIIIAEVDESTTTTTNDYVYTTDYTTDNKDDTNSTYVKPVKVEKVKNYSVTEDYDSGFAMTTIDISCDEPEENINSYNVRYSFSYDSKTYTEVIGATDKLYLEGQEMPSKIEISVYANHNGVRCFSEYTTVYEYDDDTYDFEYLSNSEYYQKISGRQQLDFYSARENG